MNDKKPQQKRDWSEPCRSPAAILWGLALALVGWPILILLFS